MIETKAEYKVTTSEAHCAAETAKTKMFGTRRSRSRILLVLLKLLLHALHSQIADTLIFAVSLGKELL